MKQVIIIGLGETASIVHEYFNEQQGISVCGFAVNKAYAKDKYYNGLPVYVLDDLPTEINSSKYVFFVALSGGRCNQDRAGVFNFVINELNFPCINCINDFTYISKSCILGINNLIMEMSSLQYNVTVGSNCVIWNGVQVCHSSKIGNNVYLSPNVTICGLCEVGENSYIGAGVVVINNITIGHNCYISAGVVIKKNVPNNTIVKANGDFVFDIDISKFDVDNFYRK